MFRLLKNNIGAADFPEAKKTFTDLIDGTTIMEAVNVNTAYDEIEALQTFLGSLGAGNTQSYSCALLDMIQGLRIGTELSYVGAEELSVAAGRIAFESSGKYRLRENTSATSVDWGDIDTGSEEDNTYYVYAVADAEATTFTIMISLSDTAPTGATYFKRLGSFVNATDITESSVIDDVPAVLTLPTIYDYGTSASTGTLKQHEDLKICYGSVSVAANGTTAITNLPFTSSSSYRVTANPTTDTSTDAYTIKTIQSSGASFTLRNTDGGVAHVCNWIAIGT